MLWTVINTIHYIKCRNGCRDDFSCHVCDHFHKSTCNTWHLAIKSQQCRHPNILPAAKWWRFFAIQTFFVPCPIPMLCSTKSCETIITKSKLERMGELGFEVIHQNSSRRTTKTKKVHSVNKHYHNCECKHIQQAVLLIATLVVQ
jgi:hypothetical protein